MVQYLDRYQYLKASPKNGISSFDEKKGNRRTTWNLCKIQILLKDPLEWSNHLHDSYKCPIPLEKAIPTSQRS